MGAVVYSATIRPKEGVVKMTLFLLASGPTCFMNEDKRCDRCRRHLGQSELSGRGLGC
jgi:hypothetical protein